MIPILGIRHVTTIASNPQRNLDFYTEVLGLRLVKRTVNFDDPEIYHLYFGDEVGTPGTIQLPVVTPEVASRFGTPPPDAFTIAPALVQPTSRGSVRLASNNFQDAAVIDGNYLGTDHDFAAIVSAIEAEREIGNQHAFDNLRESELIPGPKASAEEIQELARLASASFGYAVGTCKMGVDKLAVVDPQLRVHGLTGLRVADASVMPQIITGPGTNASAHMIAGRAADLILG
jgi:choline dehydrogenase